MKEDLITIIVPVYNVKEYLSKCLDSILCQTYKNIELILIDDGSTDGSEKICDDYAKKDNRVVVYHQTNFGVSVSRNKGLKLANGIYITFVDADDYISKDYIIDLKKNINDSIDIVISNAKDVIDDKIVDYKTIKKDIILSSSKAKEELFSGKKFSMVCWGNLYKTELAKQISFDTKMKIAEDFDFLYKYFSLTNKVKIIKECNYYYLIREGSTINSGFNDSWIRQMNYFEKLINENKDTDLKKIKSIRYVKETVNCSIRTKIRGTIKKKLKDNIKKYFFIYLFSSRTSVKDKIKIIYFFFTN